MNDQVSVEGPEVCFLYESSIILSSLRMICSVFSLQRD